MCVWTIHTPRWPSVLVAAVLACVACQSPATEPPNNGLAPGPVGGGDAPLSQLDGTAGSQLDGTAGVDGFDGRDVQPTDDEVEQGGGGSSASDIAPSGSDTGGVVDAGSTPAADSAGGGNARGDDVNPDVVADGAVALDVQTDSASAGDGGATVDAAPPSYSQPGACKKEGAEACGASLETDPANLYVCKTGKWKVLQTCSKWCESMPDGVPDRCRDDLIVPGSLETALDGQPYVEQSCVDFTHPDWPFAAKKCSYALGGIKASVVTATPSAKKVGKWIVDAAVFSPAVWALRYRDPAAYKKCLKMIAQAVLGQSSRIFPIEGGVLENMTGQQWVNYPFYHGVTDGCTSGCYCRINSLHRTEWCAYENFLGTKTYNECIAKVGSTGLTKAWGNRCLSNHVNAWQSWENAHFRAKMYTYNQQIQVACKTAVVCSPSEVVAALAGALN